MVLDFINFACTARSSSILYLLNREFCTNASHVKWHPSVKPFSDFCHYSALPSVHSLPCPGPQKAQTASPDLFWDPTEDRTLLLAPWMKLAVADMDKSLHGRPCTAWVMHAERSSHPFPSLAVALQFLKGPEPPLFPWVYTSHPFWLDHCHHPAPPSHPCLCWMSALLLCPQGNLSWLHTPFHTKFSLCSRWHD